MRAIIKLIIIAIIIIIIIIITIAILTRRSVEHGTRTLTALG